MGRPIPGTAVWSLFLFLFLLLGTSGCAIFGGLLGPPAETREREEYRVYAAVLLQLLPGSTAIQVRENTVCNQPYRFAERDPGKILSPGEERLLAGGVWDDFLRMNSCPSQLKPRFASPVRVVLRGEGEPAQGEGSEVVELSRAGFSRGLDRAVVYAGVRGTDRGGEGDFLFLERAKDGWKVVKKAFVWIS